MNNDINSIIDNININKYTDEYITRMFNNSEIYNQVLSPKNWIQDLSKVDDISSLNLINILTRFIIATLGQDMTMNIIRRIIKDNLSENSTLIIKIITLLQKPVMLRLFEQMEKLYQDNLSTDSIQSIINFINKNKINPQLERKLYSLIEEVIQDHSEKLGFNLNLIYINYQNMNEFTVNNFYEVCSKYINYIPVMNRLRSCLFKVTDTNFINNYRDEFDRILEKNKQSIIKLILMHLYPDDASKRRAINSLLHNHDKSIMKIIKAYNHVKQLLKAEAPDLELRDLVENNIIIKPTMNNAAAYVQNVTGLNNKIFAKLTIDPRLLRQTETVIERAIYHELIHMIKGQAEDTQRLYKIKPNYMSDKQWQQELHNDDTWDQASRIISNHTNLDVDSEYAVQSPFYKNDDMSKRVIVQQYKLEQLNRSHDATLICYNCGWFNVYDKWNKDCDQALNGNFTCPECKRNDVKLISPGPGEKELLNDAFVNLNQKSVNVKKNLELDQSRLQRRQNIKNELNKYIV